METLRVFKPLTERGRKTPIPPAPYQKAAPGRTEGGLCYLVFLRISAKTINGKSRITIRYIVISSISGVFPPVLYRIVAEGSTRFCSFMNRFLNFFNLPTDGFNNSAI